MDELNRSSEVVFLRFSEDDNNKFLRYGRFLGVVLLIVGVLGCFTIIGTPVAVLTIFMSAKLLATIDNLSAYTATYDYAYCRKAGQSLTTVFRLSAITGIAILITVTIVVLVLSVLIPFLLHFACQDNFLSEIMNRVACFPILGVTFLP